MRDSLKTTLKQIRSLKKISKYISLAKKLKGGVARRCLCQVSLSKAILVPG